MNATQESFLRELIETYEKAFAAADVDDFGTRSIFAIVGPVLERYEALESEHFDAGTAGFAEYLRDRARTALKIAEALNPKPKLTLVRSGSAE